jgi:hypothetical protein
MEAGLPSNDFSFLVLSFQIVMITEQISYEEKRDLAKQLADKQVGCDWGEHLC